MAGEEMVEIFSASFTLDGLLVRTCTNHQGEKKMGAVRTRGGEYLRTPNRTTD